MRNLLLGLTLLLAACAGGPTATSSQPSSRPYAMLLFGDHGFRLSPDGSTFTHGGPSTLERLTVACRMMPVHP